MLFIIPALELICFLFAAFFLRNTNNIVWIVLKWFVLFTVATDVIAAIVPMVFHTYNLWVVNLYLPVNFFVMCWALYKLLPAHTYTKPLLVSGMVIYGIAFCLEIAVKGIFVNSTISGTLSDFFIFILCNWFFYLLIKADEWIEIHKHAAFWFVTGLFLFSICAIVTDLFENELLYLFVTPKLSLRFLLYIVFNLILYGCWSYAFVCKYQETI